MVILADTGRDQHREERMTYDKKGMRTTPSPFQSVRKTQIAFCSTDRLKSEQEKPLRFEALFWSGLTNVRCEVT